MGNQKNSLEEFYDRGLGQLHEFERLTNQQAELIHRVFQQSEDGRKLLSKWKDEAVMIPSVLPHYTQFEAGIAEGVKHFIRNIIIQVESVEKGNE